jgi:hypothetical protein
MITPNTATQRSEATTQEPGREEGPRRARADVPRRDFIELTDDELDRFIADEEWVFDPR